MNPESNLQFRDQVDQIDHEMFQDEYREVHENDFNILEISDEDELMELEDCE